MRLPSKGTVTVSTGDSLWSIARAALGPQATDAQVQQAWPAIYQANRSTIGTNPSIIRPGAVLTWPGQA